MTFLADACALVAFFTTTDPERLMPNAAPILRSDRVSVLPTTVWEITPKAALGKLPRIWSPFPSLAALLANQNFERRELSWEDAEAANALPDWHRDPMDRILIAVALRADMTVLTSDAMFRSYNVKTIW